ncbi:hypothetical protein CYMTET_24829 [Cymbomonas tetramitiformis]|uniref:Protein artemis n=1 Tax=Cymbomonas tetramitiformis TaxID=36881 RepID=A0AAE0KZT5_9CHLO|nr:hypothetical protein CYMTET_24829 [Cymbomonas tetramitiformis]
MLQPCMIPVDEGKTSFVAVDYWSCRDDIVAYFLTHAHADHISGLSDTWGGRRIFCSKVTRALLRRKFPKLKAQITSLEIGEPFFLPVNKDTCSLTVTPLEAFHCAGAVQYLFECAFGRILHTGDFRWEVDEHSLPDGLLRAPIDYALVDNTFCNPIFEHPPRARAATEVLRIVRDHPEHTILFGVDSLGKEELLGEVARALKAPVYLPTERYEAVRLMGLPEELFTNNKQHSRVHAVPRQLLTESFVGSYCNSPTLGILATGLDSRAKAGGVSKCLYHVKYSLHCCYRELEAYLNLLRPRHVAGILKSGAPPAVCTDPRRQLAHVCSNNESSAARNPGQLHPCFFFTVPPPLPSSPGWESWRHILQRGDSATRRRLRRGPGVRISPALHMSEAAAGETEPLHASASCAQLHPSPRPADQHSDPAASLGRASFSSVYVHPVTGPLDDASWKDPAVKVALEILAKPKARTGEAQTDDRSWDSNTSACRLALEVLRAPWPSLKTSPSADLSPQLAQQQDQPRWSDRSVKSGPQSRKDEASVAIEILEKPRERSRLHPKRQRVDVSDGVQIALAVLDCLA